MSKKTFKEIRIFKDLESQEVIDEFNRVFINGESLNEKILTNDKLTKPLPTQADKKELVIEDENQYEIAKKITTLLGGRNRAKNYRDNTSLWVWLSFAYSKYLFKNGKNGKVVEAKCNYWPDDTSDYKTSSRHRIRGLVMLYATHGEHADFILNRKILDRGELVEQLSQNAAFHSHSVFGVFRKLFWNERKKTLRKGHTNKLIGARAVVAEVKKLMYTHACELMSSDEIIQIIHPRFKEKWLGEGSEDD